jgi:hypothetical protein
MVPAAASLSPAGAAPVTNITGWIKAHRLLLLSNSLADIAFKVVLGVV